MIIYFFPPGNSPTDFGPFRLEQDTGRVILKNSLSTLGQLSNYIINVIVEDDGSCCPGQPPNNNIGEGVLLINFVDVNSPPSFPECSNYRPRFKEGEPIGSSVINVSPSFELKGVTTNWLRTDFSANGANCPWLQTFFLLFPPSASNFPVFDNHIGYSDVSTSLQQLFLFYQRMTKDYPR